MGPYRKSRLIPWLAFIVSAVCTLPWASTVFAAPLTFNIPSQRQFGTFVSGYLTFDPSGIYFAGPFDISVGAIPSVGLPATEFTDSSVFYVIQPNTSFHSLWVFHNPFDNLFLFVSYDSCSLSGSTITFCIFEMTYYQSNCSDCPPSARVQGAIIGTPVPERVTIDLKPGSDPAPINPKSQGKIPVAILTTDTFDATMVNAATVRFGATGTEAAPVQVAVEDVNDDGRPDLLLDFNTQDTGIQCGVTSASLIGQTFNGQVIEGSDSIQTVGCQ
jgi:hypothetical protein